MNSENKFILLKILQEIEFNLKNSRIDFEGLIQMIINKRIFVTGAGRTGLIMKSFGIRLMQLGFKGNGWNSIKTGILRFDPFRPSQPDKSNSTIPLFSGSLKAGSVFKWSKKTTNP